jgi:molybdenum cofactor guanylyltransferase
MLQAAPRHELQTLMLSLFLVSVAGFVLVGGQSSRMGRDKALLAFGNHTLVEHIAGVVAAAAGAVTLIGDPRKYGELGLPVIPDAMPGQGPLGGIYTALAASLAEWNLVLACDMPKVDAGFLAALLERAERSDPDCLLPAGGSGRPEPLCAVYHSRCAPAIRKALESGVRKVLDGLRGLQVNVVQVAEDGVFQNLNTPEQLSAFSRQRSARPKS